MALAAAMATLVTPPGATAAAQGETPAVQVEVPTARPGTAPETQQARPLHAGPPVAGPFGEHPVGPGEPEENSDGPTPDPKPLGAARFVGPLHDAFKTEAAMGTATFIDGFFRTPGSPLYDAVLDRLKEQLEGAGYGKLPGTTLREIQTEMRSPAWWPLAGRLELHVEGETAVLLDFSEPGSPHRTMVPVGAQSVDATGRPALSIGELEPGGILLTKAPLSRQLVAKAASRGAAAVLSSSVFHFTVDPTGNDEHLDAIQFATAPRGAEIGVGKISARVLAAVEAAAAENPAAMLRFMALTERAERPLRTLVVEIEGAVQPADAVAIASHLQEPGAGDNAVGAAGLCEMAETLLRGIESSAIPRPARTLVFVFGNEMAQSRIWLDHTERNPVAALSADMLGQSASRTGAIALLERTPDPGAVYTIPPDAHTPWGANPVREKNLHPNGVNVVCREAFTDVARHVGGWRTSENPWEGGSDHDVFNGRGVPAALMWHFTDFTYHTSLDRMDRIDPVELRRTCTAIVAAGLALADMRSADVEGRHRSSNELERAFRSDAARAADAPKAIESWTRWCDGVNLWLAAHALP